MSRKRPSLTHHTKARRVSRSEQLGTNAWNVLLPYLQPLFSEVDTQIGRALLWLITRPTRLRLAIGVVIALTLGWSGWSFAAPASSQPLPASQQLVEKAMTITTPTIAPASDEEAIILTIAAYNQASIVAGQTIRVDLLQPYLAQDGHAWAQAQAEFERRVRRGETTDAELVRWGIVESRHDSHQATLTTKEVWNVTTSVGGTIVSSRRGTMTQTTYTLRRDTQAPDGWLITDAATTVIIA